MKTLREATDDARRAYFQEVLTATGGNYAKSAQMMGISVASYYRHLSYLFPVSRYSKSDFVLSVKRDEKGKLLPLKLPDGNLPSSPLPIPEAALPPAPPPADPFSLTEADLAPGPYLVRLSRNCAVVTDVDWANREVDFTVGPLHKRQTIEDFLKHHIKAMV